MLDTIFPLLFLIIDLKTNIGPNDALCYNMFSTICPLCYALCLTTEIGKIKKISPKKIVEMGKGKKFSQIHISSNDYDK